MPRCVPARAYAGLSARFRIHDLRHTAASLMIQAGYPPKMLQEIRGHASITTTLDLYGHLYPGDMDRYADRLDSGPPGPLIRPNPGQTTETIKRTLHRHRSDLGVRCALGGTRTPNLQIRRTGRTVWDCPLLATCWVGLPVLSARIGRWLPAWQQCQQQWSTGDCSAQEGGQRWRMTTAVTPAAASWSRTRRCVADGVALCSRAGPAWRRAHGGASIGSAACGGCSEVDRLDVRLAGRRHGRYQRLQPPCRPPDAIRCRCAGHASRGSGTRDCQGELAQRGGVSSEVGDGS